MSTLNEIEKAEKKLFDLSQSIISYGDNIKELESRDKKTEQRCVDSDLRLSNLLGQVEKAEESLKELSEFTDSMSEEFKRLGSEIDESKLIHNNVLEEYSEEAKKKREEISSLDRKILELNSEYDAQLIDNKSKEARLISSNNALVAQIEGRKEVSENIKDLIHSLRSDKIEAEKKVNVLNDSISDLKSDISSFENERSYLSNVNEKLIQKNDQVESDIKEVKTNLLDLKNLIKSDNYELIKLKSENQDEKNKIKDSKQFFENRERNVKVRELRVNKLIRDKRLEKEIEKLYSE